MAVSKPIWTTSIESRARQVSHQFIHGIEVGLADADDDDGQRQVRRCDDRLQEKNGAKFKIIDDFNQKQQKNQKYFFYCRYSFKILA